ncbi:MAG: hypothetical protein QXP42_05630 [Candidatus Micrarchaeia archaeon]
MQMKGFLFTILLSMLFLSVFMFAVFYSSNYGGDERNRGVERISYVYDDISSDIMFMLGTNSSVEKGGDSFKVAWVFSIPSEIQDPVAEFREYVSFLNSSYSEKIGVKTTILDDALINAPEIRADDLRLRYGGLKRWSALFYAPRCSSQNYSLVIYLNDSCKKKCSKSVDYKWVEEADGTPFFIKIVDADGDVAFGQDGKIKLGSWVSVELKKGSFLVSTAEEPAACVSLVPSGESGAWVTMNVSASGSVSGIYVPLDIAIDGQRYEKITIEGI